MQNSFYFIAGEKSGDMHGMDLIEAMKAQNCSASYYGIGGPEMQKAGLIPFLPFEDFQVMGFSDIIRSLPLLTQHFYTVAKEILKNKPKGVIFIDYPGFNLRLAQHLRKKGYKGRLIHYIAPSIWAWGKKRIPLMASTLDLLLTVFPFELKYFLHTNLKTVYVGNPLMKNGFKPQTPKHPLLALFPGSRLKEIERNLPLQIQTALLFLKKHPHFNVAISVSDPKFNSKILSLAQGTSFQLVNESLRYELMQKASIALAKSGTTTLELALSGCPTVVMYELTRLNYILARYLFKISLPYYALPNILLNEPIFPEHYKIHISPQELAMDLSKIMEKRAFVHAKAKTLNALLTTQNASVNAAKEILSL